MVKDIDNVILIAMLTIIRTVDPIYCQAEEIQFLQFLLIQLFSSESILAEEPVIVDNWHHEAFLAKQNSEVKDRTSLFSAQVCSYQNNVKLQAEVNEKSANENRLYCKQQKAGRGLGTRLRQRRCSALRRCVLIKTSTNNSYWQTERCSDDPSSWSTTNFLESLR